MPDSPRLPSQVFGSTLCRRCENKLAPRRIAV